MKSISNKYNKRQKNNSMFIGDSDQLNNSNVSSDQNAGVNELDNSMKSFNYSNVSPRSLYSIMNKKNDSYTVKSHMQSADYCDTSLDVNKNSNEFQFKQSKDISKMCEEQLSRLIQNTKAEMQDYCIIDTDVDISKKSHVKRNNKLNKYELGVQSSSSRKLHNNACNFNISSNVERLKKHKTNYMNYTVNSSTQDLCDPKDLDIKSIK